MPSLQGEQERGAEGPAEDGEGAGEGTGAARAQAEALQGPGHGGVACCSQPFGERFSVEKRGRVRKVCRFDMTFAFSSSWRDGPFPSAQNGGSPCSHGVSSVLQDVSPA